MVMNDAAGGRSGREENVTKGRARRVYWDGGWFSRAKTIWTIVSRHIAWTRAGSLPQIFAGINVVWRVHARAASACASFTCVGVPRSTLVQFHFWICLTGRVQPRKASTTTVPTLCYGSNPLVLVYLEEWNSTSKNQESEGNKDGEKNEYHGNARRRAFWIVPAALGAARFARSGAFREVGCVTRPGSESYRQFRLRREWNQCGAAHVAEEVGRHSRGLSCTNLWWRFRRVDKVTRGSRDKWE